MSFCIFFLLDLVPNYYICYEHMFDIKVAKLHVLKSSTSLKSLSKPYNLKVDMMCWTLKIDAFETLSTLRIMHLKFRINLVPYFFAVNQGNNQNFDPFLLAAACIFFTPFLKIIFLFSRSFFRKFCPHVWLVAVYNQSL